jgi:hypothetical protein
MKSSFQMETESFLYLCYRDIQSGLRSFGVPKRIFVEELYCDWLGGTPCAYQGTSERLRLLDINEGDKNGSEITMDLAVLPAMLV